MNRNRNPYRDRYISRSLYRIPTDIPPIILPNPHPCRHSHCRRRRLVRQRVGRVGGLTQALGVCGGIYQRNRGWYG